MEYKTQSKLERAKKKIVLIKGFYNHLIVYLVINAVLLLVKGKFVFILIDKKAFRNPEFLNWINWNVYGTTIIWGIAVLIHAIVVFGSKPMFLKRWENKQIEKYLEE